MEFRILGPLEVTADGRALDLGGHKQRTLLALLLLQANRVVSSDRLIEALWEEDPPGTAAKALQVHVSQLRKLVGRERLETRAPGYLLRVGPDELDLERFERLQEEGRLDDALALWRGAPLADFAYQRFADAAIARLEELRLSCLEERIDRDLARGRHAELVGELDALVREHPLRERLRGQLMLALYRSGRQADALDVYRDARAALVDELGIEPGRELRERHQAILEQDPELDPAADAEATPERLGGFFVGRDAELGDLGAGLGDALAGRARLFLLAGEPGVGKSRLAEELASQARDRGARVLVGRCWEAGGAPAYWPWVQALRSALRETEPETVRSWIGRGGPELTTILPELSDLLPDLPPPPADSGGSRFRLFESFASLLRNTASAQPLAIVLDDLHAADASSLLLLRFVAAEVTDAPVLVVGCYRDTEVGPELGEALAELRRLATVRRVELQGLSRVDTTRLLELAGGHTPSEDLAAKVYEETDGNPLFAGEVARLLASERRSEHSGKLPVPEGIKEAIGRRLQGMSDSCRQTLRLASVLGREFDVEALEPVSGLEQDELFTALEEAIAARLVGGLPDGGSRLRFAHVLIRDAVYEDLPATRRLRLHLEIGEALERLFAGNLEPHLAELAHHYLLAGAAGGDKAARYAAAAGDRAARQLAFEEAARHYRSALRVLEATRAGDEERICDLLLSLGDVLHRAGSGSEAKAALRSAADMAERNGWAERLARAAQGYSGRFAWARASTDPDLVPLLERGLAAIGEEDSHARVRLLARLAAATRDDRSRERRVRLGNEAVEIARRSGDPATLAYALEGYWVGAEGPDNGPELLAIGETLIRLAGQVGDKEVAFAARDHRLNTLWSLTDRAAVDVEIASLGSLADELRQPAQHWSVGTDRTMIALMEGDFEQAERLIAETLVIGQQAESWNALVTHRLALFVLRRAQGRLAELEETISRSVHEYPALLRFRCALAHLYSQLGRERDARATFDELLSLDLAQEHVDAEWLFSIVLLTDPCVFLGDGAAAAKLYSLLLSYEKRYAQAPVEVSFGSVARGLGVLASTLRRFDDAERHFAAALEIETRMRARPWIAHTQHDLATMLMARGERERASELAAEVVRAYRELGMDTWAARAEALV